MSKLRVGIAFGGRSVEHEVSISSATSVARMLDPRIYDVLLIAIDSLGRWHLGSSDVAPELVFEEEEINFQLAPNNKQGQLGRSSSLPTIIDVIFPMVHGTYGEDGSLQGALELADVPYVGSGVLGSALQMDKEVSKRLLAAGGLPTVPWLLVHARDLIKDPKSVLDRVLQRIGIPAFVKPSCLGSSVGISKVSTKEDLLLALQEASRYNEKLLVERAISGREIEVAILGNENPQASVVGEIVPKGEFYDYKSKYLEKGAELRVPAPISDSVAKRAQELAQKSFLLLEGAGLARVDLFLDDKEDELWINELNSLPGFTEISMYPKLWEATGLPYPKLLDRLIELAIERHQKRSSFERTYSSR